MTCYRRVAISDRYQINAFLGTNLTATEIAKRLGFHRSTIYRELKRNSVYKKYLPDPAHALAKSRFIRCRRRARLTLDIQNLVIDKILRGWAPEQIAGRLCLEKVGSISHETIYKFIRTQKSEPFLNGLRRFNKKNTSPKRRGKRKNPDWRLSIHDRPKIIEQRARLGDWERDGMFFKNKRQVLVCVDRKARYTKVTKVKEPYCLNITKQAEDLLNSTGKLQSITNDNGNEFMDGFYFNVPVYYCDPQKPCQRGTVENTIGLLRQYLPKKSDINDVTDKQLQSIEDQLNNRPRKCLDYKTPYEVFFNKRVALVS